MSEYKVSEPSALKFLKANGAVVDENGNVVNDATDYWKKVYDQAEPKVAKYLHSDGTIDENPGGGSGADLEDNKEVSITENGTVEITPSAGKDGMKKVTATVNVSGGGGVSKLYYVRDIYLDAKFYVTKDPATLQVGDNLIILQNDLTQQTYSVTITDIYPSEDFEGVTDYNFDGDWENSFAWQPSFSENDIDLV
jgi:hypothetical protein